MACQNPLDAIGATQGLEAVQAESLGFVFVIDGSESKGLSEPGQTAKRGRLIAGPRFDLTAGGFAL